MVEKANDWVDGTADGWPNDRLMLERTNGWFGGLVDGSLNKSQHRTINLALILYL